MSMRVCNHVRLKAVCSAMYSGFRPGPEVIKLFSCSTQLSMKVKMLINTKIAKIKVNFMVKSQKPVIYPANKC